VHPNQLKKAKIINIKRKKLRPASPPTYFDSLGWCRNRFRFDLDLWQALC
jgi:hypothetical protein